jgi:hypothetical protein
MLSKYLAAGVLMLAALALAGTAGAEDPVRLALPGSDQESTLNLKGTDKDLDADTIDVQRGGRGGSRGGYGGGFRGGYRGGYASRGYRGGFYGGYRGFSGYRGYYGYRNYGYRSYGYGYRSYAYGYGGYGGYGYGYRYYPRYSYGYSPRYYYGISYGDPAYVVYADIPSTGGTVIPTLPPALDVIPTPSYDGPSVPSTPAPSAEPGTYPYNGGPKIPVPLPRAEEKEARLLPRGPALLEDVVVDLPETTGKWTYPAYGEKPTRSTGSGPAVITGKLR